jgi:hypothetical protein
MTHHETENLASKLAELAQCEMSPKEAVFVVRAIAAKADDGFSWRLYEALRATIWKLLTRREFGDIITEWHDVYRQSAALYAAVNHELAVRISVIAELALESDRFGRTHSSADMLTKQHVQSILSFLSKQGGTAKRDDIKQAVQLEQSNLTRVLNNMSSVGLIERRRLGREKIIALAQATIDDGSFVRRPAERKSALRPIPDLELEPRENAT